MQCWICHQYMDPPTRHKTKLVCGGLCHTRYYYHVQILRNLRKGVFQNPIVCAMELGLLERKLEMVYVET